MYVKITGYESGRYSKYKLADKIAEWIIGYKNSPIYDVKEQEKVNNLSEKIESYIPDWFDSVCVFLYKFRRKRKEIVRIDHFDTWNLDHTLALIILPALKKLKETAHSYIPVKPEDAILVEIDGETPLKENSDHIIDEMIYAFGTLVDEDWEDQFYSYDSTLQSPAQLEAFKAAEERRNNGFKLFGKYYLGLWD